MRLIFSFLHIRSLLVPYAYISIESIDRNFLSSFELKAILLISSVKTLCFSLLNLFCIFNIDLLFFINCLILPMSILFSQVELLLNNSKFPTSKFSNLSFLFMTHFFVPFAFLSSLPSSIK